MRVPLLIVVGVLFSLPAFAEEDLAAKVKATCKAKWSTDYEMQKYCIDQQFEAWGNVSDKLKAFADGTEERAIVNRCAAKWQTPNGGFDFEMVNYCTDQQLKAFRALQ